jgi:polar amino acid transport system substrate-binding protein
MHHGPSHGLIRWGVALLAGAMLAASAQAQAACKTLLASGNPQYPPYLWRDPDNDTRLIGMARQ